MYFARLPLTQLALPGMPREYLEEQKFQWIGKITSSKAGCGALGSLVAAMPGKSIPVYNRRLRLRRGILLFLT